MKNRIQIPKSAKEVILPTNYILVVDTSGSMYGVIEELKDTILAITKSGNSKDTISIGRFSGSGSWEYFLRGSKLTDANFKKIVENKIVSSGCTNFNQILDATPSLVSDLKNMNDNKNFSFYFLSDGYPNDGYNESKVIDVCSKLRSSFSNSRIVGFGRNYGRDILIKMAESLKGQFIHAENLKEFNIDYSNFFNSKVTKVPVKFDKIYDVIFQVTKSCVNTLIQDNELNVFVDETDSDTYVYGLDYNDINNLDKEYLKLPDFVYGASVALAKKNKANLGVILLNNAGDKKSANILRKAFTVSAKGNAENYIAALAINAKKVDIQEAKQGMKLSELYAFFNRKDTEILIDTERFSYRSVTKKNKDISKVEIKYPNKFVKVTNTTSNEDRINLSLLTMADIEVTGINDRELNRRIWDYNTKDTTKKENRIICPIKSITFRNYAIIANGDFNVNGLPLIVNGIKLDLSMEDVEIFDSSIKEISAKQFAKLGEEIILIKAQKTALNGYIKISTTEGTFKEEDQRVKIYGTEGAILIEEMGFDSKMRFAPKKEYIPIEKDGDFLTYLEFNVSKDKCSSFSFLKTYEKFISNKQLLIEGKKVKYYTLSENIILPTIERLYTLKNTGKNDKKFIEECEKEIKVLDDKLSLLNTELVSDKFYLMTTNSWFNDVPKSDEVIVGDIKINVKEVKEYL